MSRLSGIHRRVGELTVIAGLAVLCAWWLGIARLTTVVPGWPSMKPNTAFAFILAGVALWCLNAEPSPSVGRRLRQLALGSALMTALIGLSVLVQHFGGLDFGIDRLLHRDAIRAGEAGLPGRMAPVTAFGFTLLGAALALLHVERRFATAQALLITVAGLFLLPLVHMAYDTHPLDTLEPFGLAVHTALLFVAVAAAGLWASAAHGFVRVATGPGPGAQSIRRLLPPLLGVLFALGWLTTGGRHLAYYDADFGVAIAVVGAGFGLGYAFWRNARYLTRLEVQRERFFGLGLDLFGIADIDGRFRRVNAAFSDVLGWTQAELTAKPFLEFVHPDDRAATRAEMETLGAGLATVNFSNRYQCKDGSWRRLSWKAVPVPSEGLVYATARDVTDLHETQESLRRREEYLAVLLDSIGDAVMSTDAQGLVTGLNPVGESLTGWTAADARGRPVEQVFRIINAETRAPARVPVPDTLARGTVHGLANHTVLVARDGTERPIADSCAPIRRSDGSILGAVLVYRDVTEAYAAEEALRRSEQRLRSIVDNMAAFVGEMTLEGVLIEANRTALTAGGVEREEFIGKRLEDTSWFSHSPAVQAQIRQDIEQALGGDVVRRDLDVRLAGGAILTIDFMITPVRDAAGRVVTLIPSGVDITERKRAETQILELNARLEQLVAERTVALHRSERRFADLFESAPDAVVITNRAGLITLVNGQAERMFGWTRAEMVGQPVELLMPRRACEGHVALRERYVQSGAGPRAVGAGRDLRAVRKNGQEFPVEISLSPMASDGELAVAAAVRDVTERKLLEAEFLQAQKMEGVGRLAGGIAHDFNNMLTVIQGTAELAADSLPDGDPLRQDLTAIRDATTKAALLTRQLLAFSRKQILQPVVVDLNTVVSNAETLLRRLIGEHIHIVIIPGEDLANVRVDPGQIEQVILNLALNSRDAMPNGGTLTIATTNVVLSAAPAKRRGMQPGSYVQLAVGDTGVGMDAETQLNMFEPFFTTKETGQGTGLGLSTSYGIVKQTGGEIAVDSEVGRGTTITIYFPHADGTPPPSEGVRAAAAVRGTETVLVVEDDPGIRRMVERMLARAGYTVLLAATGEEALQRLEEQGSPADLVLTDVVMPGMSGRELAERVRARHPGMKILYTSGYTDDAIVHHGVLEEGVHFIGKPYAAATLAAKVRDVLDS